MPMGSADALRDGSNYFNQVIDRYSATIAALFFGMYTYFIPVATSSKQQI